MNRSRDNLIASTQGSRQEFLHRHYWNTQDGQEMAQFYNQQLSRGKSEISKVMGESMGDRYVTEVLGYEEVFHGDSKSIRQGFDSLYRDPQKDELVVVEFKGQGSGESTLQKQTAWTVETCEKIARPQPSFPYNNVSQYEQNAAKEVLRNYDGGNRMRYEVVRTEIDPKTGEFWTQIEKQTYLEQGLEQSYSAQTLTQEQRLTHDLDVGMSAF
ncbi:hypothetical protein [Kamptonema sp. UHCC 0994]|uniref:hypothetical protein n=1 Tax=Kamptonema sp. UHCC 0994 TaxID=3031329 RepID=UPI0023B94F77|nr:hypothetical protein [Kamptonema sp. UHCC 0994]MDF0555624.1 hypothetical protein [Kamptonema sp. UHCC 0994]